ncbi:hypothetical protein PHLGIDRAFT_345496 [Phlebiopsis gigantea 11061_1 CR5-6]|uniref:F-box domain-containing protein n=1 Tax=Phlebiopsis gigantea (strain 11061_1 CR5-6) TaxID=745531 RepID=A0A0C3NAR3_PHLG1|nr:hypothetical protein PHLGIDRAFT_345496 [Phlebiopsis gigantea 11061_1 CR5-6]
MATRTHPVRTLPTEICERIIDFVAEEVQYAARISMWEDEVFNTLQACALTCRAWTPRSQLHLFRFLGVDCSYKTKHPLADFYEFMDRHKPLQAYVEALLARADDYKMSAMHILPIRMPRLLPQLAHLQLIKGVLYVPSGPFFQVSMRQFTMVRELVLYKIAFYSVQDLRRVAGAMQNLRSLSVTCVSWHRPSTKPPPTSYLPTRVRLTTLRIDSEAEWAQDPRSVYFVEWLVRSGMSTSLVALYLGCLMIQDYSMFVAVEAVLRGCCQTIQEVGLSWSPNLDVDISSCE